MCIVITVQHPKFYKPMLQDYMGLEFPDVIECGIVLGDLQFYHVLWMILIALIVT